MIAFVGALLCVSLAALNIPFFPNPVSVFAFVWCLAMAGVNVGIGLSSRR